MKHDKRDDPNINNNCSNYNDNDNSYDYNSTKSIPIKIMVILIMIMAIMIVNYDNNNNSENEKNSTSSVTPFPPLWPLPPLIHDSPSPSLCLHFPTCFSITLTTGPSMRRMVAEVALRVVIEVGEVRGCDRGGGDMGVVVRAWGCSGGAGVRMEAVGELGWGVLTGVMRLERWF